MASFSKKGGRPPPTQWPFPRDITRPVTAPAWDPSDSVEVARQKWLAWLRVIARIEPMRIPARSGGHRHTK